MSRIDYSKWDRMDFSDDDEEDAPSELAAPRVTKLSAPSRVTRNEQGDLIITEEAPGKERSSSKRLSTEITVSWTEKGDRCTVGDGLALYWSQDRNTVRLRISLPPNASTKNWDCKVEGIVPYSERHTAVSAEKHRLVVKQGSATTYRGELAHPVHLPEDEEGIDWSIERLNDIPYVEITLHKAVPTQVITLWWKRPLMDCPEIDIDWRDESAASTLQNAWNEAHRLFKEKHASS